MKKDTVSFSNDQGHESQVLIISVDDTVARSQQNIVSSKSLIMNDPTATKQPLQDISRNRFGNEARNLHFIANCNSNL